jgi:hypothetical protein
MCHFKESRRGLLLCGYYENLFPLAITKCTTNHAGNLVTTIKDAGTYAEVAAQTHPFVT